MIHHMGILIGGLTFIWVIAWFILTADTPAEHSRISEAEKQHIESSIEYDTNKRVCRSMFCINDNMAEF